MKYYTDTISVTLAKKLKESGINIPSISKYIIGNQVRHYDRDYDGDMPIIGTREYHDGDLIRFSRIDEECNPMCCNAPTYAEVFDRLMEKDYTVAVNTMQHRGVRYMARIYYHGAINCCFEGDTWHEAAEAAIEKVLTLF